MFTVLSSGFGKRTRIEEYRRIRRGGQGVKNVDTRGATVVKSLMVKRGDEVLLLTREGMSIRISTDTVSVFSRNARGVKLIKLEEGDEVVNAAKISD